MFRASSDIRWRPNQVPPPLNMSFTSVQSMTNNPQHNYQKPEAPRTNTNVQWEHRQCTLLPTNKSPEGAESSFCILPPPPTPDNTDGRSTCIQRHIMCKLNYAPNQCPNCLPEGLGPSPHYQPPCLRGLWVTH
uniref:Uncharacterized protein n=1 Tax=Eutreptiella gymnastica TaxID=73025 RepID=A0A7S4FFE5_9EUGL|mmetsp:Transcript_106337/g.179549  ORF Transcript_106337/g.179549 Transcript_106337/m.179549 type:complete len:133 (-) Transcript_106337:568-966(-)